MESANKHHELQDQIVGLSSCSSTPSCYGVGSSVHSDLTTNYSILNYSNGYNSYPNETTLNQRQQESTHLSSQYCSMPQDLSFPWDINSSGIFVNNPSKQDLQISRVKQEQLQYGNFMNKMELFPGYVNYSNVAANNGRINVASYLNPCSLEMNSHALNFIASSRFSGEFIPYSENRFELLRDSFLQGEGANVDHMHQMQPTSLYTSNKISALAESKGKMDRPKAFQAAPKRSRLEGRVSCPPFKVRKEKLGDRIAALQQLVAPFGKTDTASVLMEAIGYIKFLQSQVETLSVPYMKAPRNKTSRATTLISPESEREEPKCDLKSRGLCLVPLPCLSYITDGAGGPVWSLPN